MATFNAQIYSGSIDEMPVMFYSFESTRNGLQRRVAVSPSGKASILQTRLSNDHKWVFEPSTPEAKAAYIARVKKALAE